MADPLAPFFLGAYGENNHFFEKVLLELVCSCTTVPLSHLGREELQRTSTALELELAGADDDGLFLLRHTLMNPWLQVSPGPGEPSYIEAYCHFLGCQIQALLATA